MSQEKTTLYDDAILRTLKNNYPYLDLNYLQYFRQVFYPIAEISAGIQQECFEDFTIVERSVLKLVGLGFRSVEKIADLLGLTATYVTEVLTILQDYEHVNDGLQITRLGKRCLKEDRKIRLVESRRVFEVDAVNGYPLQLDQSISSDGMKYQQQLHKNDLILLNMGSVSQEELLEGFQQAFEQRQAQRIQNVLHINVRKMKEPVLQQLKYGCAYLMVLQGYAPMLFAKIVTTGRNQSAHYKWQPIAVMDEKTAKLLQWDSPIFFSPRGKQMVQETIRFLQNRAEDDYAQKLVATEKAKLLEETLHLSPEGYQTLSDGLYCVRSEAFTRFNREVFQMLTDLGSVNNIYAYVNATMRGNILRFVRDVQDQKLAYVCQHLKVDMEEQDFHTLYQTLAEEISTEDPCPVIDRIVQILNLTLPA